MEKLLNEDIVRQVKEVFDAQLQHPVQVLFFGRKQNCEQCEETRQLVEEVAAISDKVGLSLYDIEQDAEIARQYNVSMAPGLVIAARDGEQITDYGVRLAGIPAGYEFSTLIQDILIVSGRDSGLSTATRQALKSLKQPVHLQVFVTPTCPYCPRAVVLAHQMAIESPYVQAEMVEAIEFPELAERHHVSGVPQTTINDGRAHVVGAVPEEHLMAEIQRVLQ